MHFDKIHNKGQARLFKNQYLEYLTKTHPLVIWGMYLPIAGFMLYFSKAKLSFTFLQTGLVFVAGIVYLVIGIDLDKLNICKNTVKEKIGSR